MKILITGATSGIGLALSKLYNSHHHEVIAIGRNKQALIALENEGIEVWQLDLVDLNSTRSTFQKLKEKHGLIDLAILNAGNCEYVDCKNFNAELIKRVFDANIITLANSIEGVLPLLRNSHNPHLAGVASMAGYLPLSRAEAYGASKAAANYLLETLAIDLTEENIMVSVINPGFVKTPLTAKNDFPMPFALEVGSAAEIIFNGLAAKKAEIDFPLRLTIPMKFMSILPRSWWRKLADKLKRKD
jgi:short-subunit dehydrogenase